MVNGAGAGPIASMTGFATAEGVSPGLRWTWEIRGVNGRGLDLRLRVPDGLGALEAPLRKLLGERLARGSVSLNLRLTRAAEAGAFVPDRAALEATLASLVQVRAMAEAQGMALADPSPVEILSLRGGETSEGPDLPTPEALIVEAEALVEAFTAMRHAEGRALAQVLSAQMDRIAALVEEAAAAAVTRAEAQAETFRANLRKVLETVDVDEARLAQELALLAVKADVTEELDRLRAHVGAVRDLLAAGGPVGRKLDFLMQEFNREANTLCSKSGDAALTAVGLDLKLAIDQTREQVQNVE